MNHLELKSLWFNMIQRYNPLMEIREAQIRWNLTGMSQNDKYHHQLQWNARFHRLKDKWFAKNFTHNFTLTQWVRNPIIYWISVGDSGQNSWSSYGDLRHRLNHLVELFGLLFSLPEFDSKVAPLRVHWRMESDSNLNNSCKREQIAHLDRIGAWKPVQS